LNFLAAARRDIERYEHIVWFTEANRCPSLGHWQGRSWPDARKQKDSSWTLDFDEVRMARLLSVNVGLPRDVTWNGNTIRTAVWKSPDTRRRQGEFQPIGNRCCTSWRRSIFYEGERDSGHRICNEHRIEKSHQ